MVVEVEIAIEGGRHSHYVCEEAPAELDAPEFAENGALHPFHKAIGPGAPNAFADLSDRAAG